MERLALRRRCWMLVGALIGLLAAAPAAWAGTFTQATYGGRSYWLFVPAGYQAGVAAPLVMMLHGCTQTGDGFATSTGMNALAEAETFLAIYPQQPSSANSSQCWNWFEPTHQARGAGEPAYLAALVGQVSANYAVAADRVFVAGFSAGAGMAVILGATYPDVFAALGVHSGLEYKAATSSNSAFTAMFSGGPPAGPQGQAAYAAMGSRARVVPVMVLHGTSDFTVVTANGDLVLSQWAQTNDLASDGLDQGDIDDTAETVEAGQVPGGRSFTRSYYEDATGRVILQKIKVDGMGHNWSGGVLGGTYTDPNGPNASRMLVDFFLGSAPPPVDTTPPTTTANPPGGTYSGPIVVTLTPNESATTYYTLDGSTPDTGSWVYSSAIPLDATTTLKFFSVDGAGDIGAVRTEIYTFSAAAAVVLTSIDAEDGTAGQLWADGTSTTVHRVGDKGLFNVDTYRLILSFDPSAIPGGAVITGATLTIYRAGLLGSVTQLTADVATQNFGSSAALVQSDYSAAATSSAAFPLGVPAADGAATTVALPAAVLGLIPGSRLQIRLRATTPANFASDVLTVHGGGAGALAPKLEVTYE